MPNTFETARSGGGIAGLTLASTLGKYSTPDMAVQVDIYEADPEVRTVGAGITVWPRTWDVMRHLSLYDQLQDVSVGASQTTSDSLGFSECMLHPSATWRVF